MPARYLIFAFFALGLLGACREANPRYKGWVMHGADAGSKVLSFDGREELPGDGEGPPADLGGEDAHRDIAQDRGKLPIDDAGLGTGTDTGGGNLGDLAREVGTNGPWDAIMDTLRIIQESPDSQPDVSPVAAPDVAPDVALDVVAKVPVDAENKDTAPDIRAEVAARDVGVDTARDSQPDVVVTTGLSVQYRCLNPVANASNVNFSIKIVNGSSRAISLSNFKVRYYFTLDGYKNITAICDWAAFHSRNVSFVVGTTTGTNANRYIEISFAADAGLVAAGTVSGEAQVRFYDSTGLYPTTTQTNDYSFDPTKAETFAEWTRVTLHQSGVLIWGTPP